MQTLKKMMTYTVSRYSIVSYLIFVFLVFFISLCQFSLVFIFIFVIFLFFLIQKYSRTLAYFIRKLYKQLIIFFQDKKLIIVTITVDYLLQNRIKYTLYKYKNYCKRYAEKIYVYAEYNIQRVEKIKIMNRPKV